MRAFALTIAAVVVASTASAQANPWGQGASKNKPNGHYADVNGIHLYYEVHGAPVAGKAPLVLLHGGLGAIEMFGPNLPMLAKGRQLIALDLHGHGRTPLGNRPFRIESMADDVAALVAKLGLGRADVMGYSLGAGVALQTAIRHPEIVNRLVLVSTVFRRSAFYPDILAQQAQVNAQAAEMMKATPMWALYSGIAPNPAEFPKLLDAIGALMKVDSDWSAQIPSVKAPALIVQADADIVPPSHAVELFGLLGGGKKDGGWDGSGRIASRLAIVPGLTHYNIFADTTVTAIAIPFLDQVAPIGR